MYVLDTYNKYDKNDDVISTFALYGNWYCIRKVKEYQWGKPIIHAHDFEDGSENDYYHLFSSLKEAQDMIKQLKIGESIND